MQRAVLLRLYLRGDTPSPPIAAPREILRNELVGSRALQAHSACRRKIILSDRLADSSASCNPLRYIVTKYKRRSGIGVWLWCPCYKKEASTVG